MAAPAAAAKSSINFIFFFSPIPFPALTTRSAWVIGVSAAIPTVKSYPSFFRLSTRASTLSSALPLLKIIFLRIPVTAGFLATLRLPPPGSGLRQFADQMRSDNNTLNLVSSFINGCNFGISVSPFNFHTL